MTHYWEYFAANFENGKKMCRIVKKSKSISDYSNFIANLACPFQADEYFSIISK
jgi:hypothetical protein